MGVMYIALASFRGVSGVRSYVRGSAWACPRVFPPPEFKIGTSRAYGHGRSLGM